MIPFVATIQLRHGDGRQFCLWIPLFLVWLLLLPLVLVVFPVVLVVGLWMRVNAFNLYWTAWRILASMRDTLVEVKSGKAEFRFRMV
jgi:hypothetical protein